MSACDTSLPTPVEPYFSGNDSESPSIEYLLQRLNLLVHPEAGYFAETDRDSLRIPNPFLRRSPSAGQDDDSTRSASTTIFYLLTPKSPLGSFHRNKGRTVHTLHKGRGRYVLIHADEASPDHKARVETFVVGQDVAKGERLQWIVDGGKYKASLLLPDQDGGNDSPSGLLISETVIPGFEFADHDFLKRDRFEKLVTEAQAKELSWLLRREQ